MIRTATVKTAACAAMFAAGLQATPASSALDDANSTGIVWTCSQEHDAYFHVSCVPQHARVRNEAAPADSLRERELARGEAAARQSNPAFHGHDMRPVAARGEPEVFSTRAWRVPLYSQPGKPAAVAGLLESVLCGAESNCTVTYDGGNQAPGR